MPEPRQVVFLATDFRPLTGGIAEYLHQLAHHLSRHVSVTVMTTVEQNGADWERAYRLEQLPMLPARRLGQRTGDRIPALRRLHTGAYFLALRGHGRRIADRLSTMGEGTLAVIGSWDTASHFWCEACRTAGVPYALAAYGAEILLPLYGRLPAWRKRDFADAARVFACSRATGDLAADRFGLVRAPAVVHPALGSKPPDADICARVATLRRELNLPDGSVLFSLGRLVRRKGFDLVLRGVADLSGEFESLSSVIAGDGPERGALEALARDLGVADRVRITGPIDELTKWALYNLCDVFVMPNRSLGGADWEGFGLVFAEAALSGRPVIGGRTGGTADAVVDTVAGLLIDPEAPGALTAAMRRLISDPGLRHRMGRSGEDIARTQFSGRVIGERLWDALR